MNESLCVVEPGTNESASDIEPVMNESVCVLSSLDE